MRAKIKNILQKVKLLLGKITPKQRIITLVMLPVGVFLISIVIQLLVPEKIELSLRVETCVSRATVLPGLAKGSLGEFEIDAAGSSKIWSNKLCFKPNGAPKPGIYAATLPIFGISFLRHPLQLVVPDYPQAKIESGQKIPLSKPLKISLSYADELSNYVVRAANTESVCRSEGNSLSCQVAELGIEQGSEYNIALWRSVDGSDAQKVATGKVAILEPVQVTSSSIEQGSTIYDKPSELRLEFDKPLLKYDVSLFARKGEESHIIDIKSTLEAQNTLIIELDTEGLPRESIVELVAERVEASDGSTVESPTILSFSTSGGPKVETINIGSHDVPLGSVITVQFDQELDQQQDVSEFFATEGLSAAMRTSGSRLIITPSADSRCNSFTIKVKKGVKSQYGIASESEWSHSSKMRCYEAWTIGHSVQGRPISAFVFGDGSRTMLYTGAIHGNELSSKQTMDAWISELSARSSEIPAGTRVVVIPSVSPDGVALGRRYNANDINLNRNFPTANWTANAPVSGGQIENGAGGSSPLSEPESRTLADFTRQIGPQFVVTFHSTGSLVNSNDVGSSIAIGQQYARLTGYRFIPNADTNAIFGLEMTGTYEDWLLEIGVPAILIELPTHRGDYLPGNRSALWMTLRG